MIVAVALLGCTIGDTEIPYILGSTYSESF